MSECVLGGGGGVLPVAGHLGEHSGRHKCETCLLFVILPSLGLEDVFFPLFLVDQYKRQTI